MTGRIHDLQCQETEDPRESARYFQGCPSEVQVHIRVDGFHLQSIDIEKNSFRISESLVLIPGSLVSQHSGRTMETHRTPRTHFTNGAAFPRAFPPQARSNWFPPVRSPCCFTWVLGFVSWTLQGSLAGQSTTGQASFMLTPFPIASYTALLKALL